MFLFLLSSLCVHLIGSVFALLDPPSFTLPEVCDPIECFRVLDTFFQPNTNWEAEYQSCEKITKLERCVQLCTENKTDIFFLKGLAEIKLEACNFFNRGVKLENKCENRHKFRLLSCIYDRFNLEAKDPNANNNLVMCKRAIFGELCDVDNLPQCTDRQSYLSEALLGQLFLPMKSEFCRTFSYADTEDLKRKPLSLAKDIDGLADCLDANSPYVTDCIPKKWNSTNMQQKNKLCSDVQTFFDCVQGVVGNKCNNTQKAFFSMIRQPVFLYLLPHCAKKQEGASPFKSPVTFKNLLNEVDNDSANALIPAQNKSVIAGVQGLNKVYSDPSAATTISPPNISEVVVVHQHVIITMTYKDKNSANQIYVPFCLIVLAIMFGMGF